MKFIHEEVSVFHRRYAIYCWAWQMDCVTSHSTYLCFTLSPSEKTEKHFSGLCLYTCSCFPEEPYRNNHSVTSYCGRHGAAWRREVLTEKSSPPGMWRLTVMVAYPRLDSLPQWNVESHSPPSSRDASVFVWLFPGPQVEMERNHGFHKSNTPTTVFCKKR